MKFLVLSGSPRKNGNTEALVKPFIAELERLGAEVDYIYLPEKSIAPCKACYACMNKSGEYGCAQRDDMDDIAAKIIAADCLVLATPIYNWSCTAPMKAMIDRTYALNKFYGSIAREALLGGKGCAIITSHGYDADYAASPFETGISRWCKHSEMNYLGMYSVRDEDDLASFTTDEAQNGAKEFAGYLFDEIEYALSKKAENK